VSSQHAMASRQSMMGTTQEADLSGYRTHSAQGTQYGGPYAAVYGSTALSSAHQVIVNLILPFNTCALIWLS